MDEDQRARLARCERHGLAYDPAKSSGCVLCQGHSSRAGGFPPLDRVMTGLLVAIVVLLGGGIALHLALPAFEHVLGSTAPPAPSAVAPAARTREPAEAA